MSLYKTVTVTQQVPVDHRIADLVYFFKYVYEMYGSTMSSLSDNDLIELAEKFWDRQHGED